MVLAIVLWWCQDMFYDNTRIWSMMTSAFVPGWFGNGSLLESEFFSFDDDRIYSVMVSAFYSQWCHHLFHHGIIVNATYMEDFIHNVTVFKLLLWHPRVTSSVPLCKNLVVLRHPQEFNDMSPKSLQLKRHCPFPDINCLSNSTPDS